MPVIPVGTGSQVLNAGSPVPIASSADERGFGDAMAFLGKTLAGVARQASAETDQARVTIANQEYERKVFDQKVLQSSMPPLPDDKDGLGAVNQLRERMAEERLKFEESLDNDDQKIAFRAQALNLENNAVVDYYGTEVKKKQASAESLVDASISATIAEVRHKPGELDNVIKKAQIINQNSSIISAEKKAMNDTEIGSLVVKEAYDGKVLANDFNGAKAILDAKGSLLSVSDRKSLYRDLDEQQYKHVNRISIANSKEEAKLRQRQRDVERTMVGKMFAMQQVAGNTTAIENDIFNHPDIPPKEKIALLSPRDVPVETEKAFTTLFVNEAIFSGDTEKAENLLMGNLNNKVSVKKADYYSSIAAEERIRNEGNPVRVGQMKEANALLKKSVTPEADIGTLQGAFFGQLKADPSASPLSLAYRALGNVVPLKNASIVDVDKNLASLKTDYLAKKATMTPAQNAELVEKIRQLNLEKQILQERQNAGKP